MARFMIQWCAPDPTSDDYTKAIVDYIKGGKPMDEFAGFKLLARQIHPQTGGGVLLVEADNLAAVQKHTYPWTKGLESRRRSPLDSAMRSLSSLRKE